MSIKFPDRRSDKESAGNEAQSEVVISGQPGDVEAAKSSLLELIPIVKTICVPVKYHRHIIGAGGKAVREIMQEHDVHIKYDLHNTTILSTFTLPNFLFSLAYL